VIPRGQSKYDKVFKFIEKSKNQKIKKSEKKKIKSIQNRDGHFCYGNDYKQFLTILQVK
jgi:hypothetical protein